MDSSNTRKGSEVAEDRFRPRRNRPYGQTNRRVCTAGEVWDRATGSCPSETPIKETKANQPIKTSLKIIGVIVFIFWGIWASCTNFKGELPNGRWEWAHGTHERISEVIKLEDQHGDE